MPGAMPAELAERLSDVPAAANDDPDFSQTEDLEDLVADDLAKPLAALFSTRDQIRQLQRSEAFSDSVNHRKAVEWLLKDIEAVERELRRLWADA